MTDHADSLLSAAEIADRLQFLERRGFPQGPVQHLASDIAAFCRGSGAEQALGQLVGLLAPEQVLELLASYIPLPYVTASDLDFSGPGYFLIAQELVRRGFGVTSDAITLPDGMELASAVGLGPPRADDDPSRLCRLALLGLSIVRMRARPPGPPAY